MQEIEGLYWFDENLDPVGHIVRPDPSIWLRFDKENEFLGLCLAAFGDYFLFFSVDNDWVGYAVRVSGDVFLVFNDDNDWVGMTT